jgi:hypothetical protein
MNNRYLKITSKLIIFIIIFIIIIYAVLYGSNSSKLLKNYGFGFYNQSELRCLKSICINRNGIEECILMKIPILIKTNQIRDMNYYSGNVYELHFDVISDRCE